MKVSLNTVKQYTGINRPLDELVEKINTQLGAIEEITDLKKRYESVVIVKVVSAEQHPDADRLKVTRVDDGGVVPDVPRDTDGYIQVVCGAPNVAAGMFAAWLPPSSVVPASYNDKELFTLEARKIRGVMSQGMLAAADELAIGNDHEGILEINPDEWKPSDVTIEPGASFAKAYGLDDIIIDVENKMFTHRPDLFGQLGVAREIAGIYGKSFDDPDWYWSLPKFSKSDSLKLEISNDIPDVVPRFMAVAMQGVTIKPSPLWLQCELVRFGSKPINNIVDITNYIMLLTAQPTHAYDYDKLRGNKLGVRFANEGESANLLNGKTYELHSDDIVIVDGEGIVGLGGIMGGGNSEVSEDTKNIVLEVANFNMYTVRKSSMRHGIFTDALTRFNKGQSPLQNDRIMALLMSSIKDAAGGEQASEVYDEIHDKTSYDRQSLNNEMKITAQFINERLGLSLKSGDIETLLRNVHFACTSSKDTLTITAPFWRTDIELPEDIVEEVGRLYGYHKLPRILPSRTTKPTRKNYNRERKQQVRETLRRAGANEVLTYSFVHQKVIENSGQSSEHAYKLANALSPDLQYYRLGLTPSLLDKVHMNHKAGYDKFALFELNKVHYKGEMQNDEPQVPNEDDHVALVLAYGEKSKPAGAPYYHARMYVEQIIDLDTVELVPLSGFDISKDEWGAQLVAPYEPSRSAVLVKDGQVWGVVGEFKQNVKRAFKLPDYIAGFEVHQDLISIEAAEYVALSRYPSVTQDISLKTDANTSYDKIISVVNDALPNNDNMRYVVSPLSIYQPDQDTSSKTTTFRIVVTSYNSTLREDDVSSIVGKISAAAKKLLKAETV